MRRLVPVAVAIAVAAGVAALPSAGATSSKPKPRHVAVKDDFFDPKRITVKKGTKVVWAWKGSERHNVAVAQGPLTFRAGTRRKGTFKHTFRKRGTYSIVCTIHAPDMHMTVKVK
jgi:plastocyanin